MRPSRLARPPAVRVRPPERVEFLPASGQEPPEGEAERRLARIHCEPMARKIAYELPARNINQLLAHVKTCCNYNTRTTTPL